MKFLILGDPHGVIPKIPSQDTFDAIICPGDFCNDVKIRTYLEKSRKKNVPWYTLCTKKQLKAIEKDLVISGTKVLIALSKINKPVFVVPGNWDEINFGKKTIWEQYNIPKNITNLHMKSKELPDITLIGYGKNGWPELPMYNLHLYSKKQIQSQIKQYVKTYNKIEKIIDTAKKPKIVIVHNPPFESPFDVVKNKSPMKGKHVGSQIAKQILIEKKPFVIISGHMHEYATATKIKKTILISSGYKKTRFIFDTKTKKVRKI